ncbi:hypothetical protein LCGC14_1089360 [marine sediment metagenome]|uniref:Uncharacterized protein n=1 Tax=marine sediment metagenome TaxID=412755 RepID=A0A0F9QIV5_9ZZZZ
MYDWAKHLMVDFDGVINSYVSGYNHGQLSDPPMEGAVRALEQLVSNGFRYTVFTTRMALTDNPARTKLEILGWLERHGFPAPEDVTAEKRPALVYIDDRARRFTNWEDVRKTYA